MALSRRRAKEGARGQLPRGWSRPQDTERGMSEGPGLLGAAPVEIFGPCSGHCCSLPELQGTEPCLAPQPSCPPPGHLAGLRDVLLGTEVAKKW